MKKGSTLFRTALITLMAATLTLAASAATAARPTSRKPQTSIQESSAARQKMSRAKHSRPVVRASAKTRKLKGKRRRFVERFYTSSFADDAAAGDVTAGEDPIVRQAAVDALGNMNGTVVAIDPNSGRILAMVNQKLALSEGAQPCSTIKLAVALAGLSENVVNKDTQVQLGKYWRMNLTKALAVSNNNYFEALGRKLGFEKVAYYAHQFGLGELAGWNVEGEHLGEYPSEVLDSKLGGVGKMCSFGESISMTPLQLGALVASIANGGTLYYLQHPRNPQELTNFQPVVKRQLEIKPLIPEISEGMAGAVEYGTARTVHYNFSEEQVLGKTGTCSKDGTRFGWFASFANTQYGRVAVVVFLRGGRPTYGPKAAEIAGRMYRNLYDHSFFAATTPVRSAGAAVGVSQ
jgi:penicillin-binding protein 2